MAEPATVASCPQKSEWSTHQFQENDPLRAIEMNGKLKACDCSSLAYLAFTHLCRSILFLALFIGTRKRNQLPIGRLSARNFYGFKFRLLTSRDSHARSFSHRNRPTLVLTCTFTPLRPSHQDEHGQEDKNRLKIFQSCPQATTTN